MSINSVNNVPNVSFKESKAQNAEKQQKSPEEIKDGKKKLALAAASIATMTLAGIAIANKVRKGKGIDNKEAKAIVEGGKKAVDETVEQGQKTAEKITNNVTPKTTSKATNHPSSTDEVIKLLPTVEEIEQAGGRLDRCDTSMRFYKDDSKYRALHRPQIPFYDSAKTESLYGDITYNLEGENAGKYEISKYFRSYNEAGERIGKPQRATIIYDPKTGEKTVQTVHEKTSEPMIRKTVNGITTINGKQKATRTIEKLEDGTKKITVDYGNNRKKFITITPEGKRTEEVSKNLFLGY